MSAKLVLIVEGRSVVQFIPTHLEDGSKLHDGEVLALLRAAVVDLWYIALADLETDAPTHPEPEDEEPKVCWMCRSYHCVCAEYPDDEELRCCDGVLWRACHCDHPSPDEEPHFCTTCKSYVCVCEVGQ